jgi:hypothetical protein
MVPAATVWATKLQHMTIGKATAETLAACAALRTTHSKRELHDNKLNETVLGSICYRTEQVAECSIAGVPGHIMSQADLKQQQGSEKIQTIRTCLCTPL